MEIIKAKNQVEMDLNFQSLSRVGFCREWTRAVILFIKQKFPFIIAEAREVSISPNLQHTFIKLSEDDKVSYLYDGVGTLKHKPYFGLESQAPEHLKNSRPDMINKYLCK